MVELYASISHRTQGLFRSLCERFSTVEPVVASIPIPSLLVEVWSQNVDYSSLIWHGSQEKLSHTTNGIQKPQLYCHRDA